VQAVGGGSEAYMRKEAGYVFPTHRLKRKMKGTVYPTSAACRVLPC
jgi:hypothetical protein